jgi:hypothetical protein
MEKDRDQSRDSNNAQSTQEQDRERHNPFKDATASQSREETPQEEAAMEQERKEAMTERD